MRNKKRAWNLDDCHYISTRWLKIQNFLIAGNLSYTDVEFISAGEQYNVRVVASITDTPVLILQFMYKGELKRVEIELIRRLTNYGGHGSSSFYLICPKSGRKSMKLFFYKGQVISAKATFLNYRSQILDNRLKRMTAKYGKGIAAENAMLELNTPGLRMTYKGKTTNRVKRLLRIIKAGESCPDFTMENLNNI